MTEEVIGTGLAQTATIVQTEAVLEAQRSTSIPQTGTLIMKRTTAPLTIEDARNQLRLDTLQTPRHVMRNESRLENWQSGFQAGIARALALMDKVSTE